jgi:hypothetical protein
MREGFREITSGWTLISGVEPVTDRIDQVLEWSQTNSPLEPDEVDTLRLMLEVEFARSMEAGE